MNRAFLCLVAALGLAGSGCLVKIGSDKPDRLNQSPEELRLVEDEWEKIWFQDQDQRVIQEEWEKAWFEDKDKPPAEKTAGTSDK